MHRAGLGLAAPAIIFHVEQLLDLQAKLGELSDRRLVHRLHPLQERRMLA